MRASRFAVFVVLSAFVTFGLFWIMQALVAGEGGELEDSARQVIEFVRLKREEVVEEKKRELPDKTPPEDQPPPPEMQMADTLRPDVSGDGFAVGGGEMELDTGSGLGVGGADQDVVPLVRVNPQYPIRAAQRGVEGWVELEFTISRTGTVKDAQVTGFYPSGIFNDAALRAIRRWKYNPKMENGKPVERPGVTVRLVFQLNK